MVSDLKKVIYSLHPLEKAVLPFIDKSLPSDIVKESKLSLDEVMKGLLFLEQRSFLTLEKKENTLVTLDKLGLDFVKNGLPEIQVLSALDKKESYVDDLGIDKQIFSSALGVLKREGLVEVKKDEKGLLLIPTDKAQSYLSSHTNPLKEFEEGVSKEKLTKGQQASLDQLKRRPGLVKEVSSKEFIVKAQKEGLTVSKELVSKYKDLELIDALDSDMLKKGTWKGKEFRHYDTQIEVPHSTIARRHPMLEANNILRDVFVEMGFQEMEGPIVETAFWNMDSMWIPQDHPARDEQDTFYLEGEGKVPADLMKEVKKMHEEGLKRTHTEKGDWSEKVTKRRLLRTHSTATTFRTIAQLGKKHAKGESIEGKWFYIALDFRNEAIDATHLAEFYQGEGFIVGDNLSLADLMGFIREYYAKLGITKIKFKPTYNPYTEPSMEAHYYDPVMKKWYSLINSGIFRPETLKPFGLEDKTIIAWGMGASRVATLLANVNSMRDITGVTCDLEWLKTRPMMKREITRK